MNLTQHLIENDFFDKYWGKRIYTFNQSDFVLEDIDLLDNLTKNNKFSFPELRVLQGKNPVNPFLYTYSSSNGLDEDIDINKLHQMLKNHSITIKIKDIDNYHNRISSLKQDFCDFFVGADISVNGYFSSANSLGGLGHYDSHHIFALQLEGTKNWHLGDILHSSPHKDFPHINIINEPRIKNIITTKKNDIIYIPPGLWHRVFTESDSTHLTIGVNTPRVYKLICNEIMNLALNHGLLRSDMPIDIRDNDVSFLTLSDKNKGVIFDKIMSLVKNL